MDSPTPVPSPASKSFAATLAQYAYSPDAGPSKLRPRPTRSTVAPPSPSPSPSPARSRSRPSRSASASKRRREDDNGGDEEFKPSAEEVDVDGAGSSKTGSVKVKPKGKVPRGYADPQVYAHLRPVQDLLQPDLDLVFCGINPGKKTAMIGHHFGHPTNKFWRALHQSGLTDRLLTPHEDVLLPGSYNYGMTNLVDRPTAEQSELSTLEMRLAVPAFTHKIARHSPRLVCFVGKKIWDTFEEVANKTAVLVPPPPPALVLVSTEQTTTAGESDNEEPLVKVEPEEIVSLSAAKLPPARKSKPLTSSRPPFEWSRPQPLRLPSPNPVTPPTYFWVVPNTSGLERTPLNEQVVLFTRLREFKDKLMKGYDPALDPAYTFRDIDVDGVERTAESIRAAAVARGKR